MLGGLQHEQLRSVTPNRGMEFAKHDEIFAALKAPLSSFRFTLLRLRRTNENTNDLIRSIVPVYGLRLIRS